MLTLYVKTGCAYCAVVLHELAELELEFEEKNVEDDIVAAELVAKGGKKQMPYLVDSAHNVAMYESADIVEYLAKTYGTGDGPKSDVPNVCIPDV